MAQISTTFPNYFAFLCLARRLSARSTKIYGVGPVGGVARLSQFGVEVFPRLVVKTPSTSVSRWNVDTPYNCQQAQKHLIGNTMATQRKISSSRVSCDSGSAMDLEQKRRSYNCGSNFVTLAGIPTWPQDFASKRSLFKVSSLKSDVPVDNNLASRVSLWRGDITGLEIDAIVNAANSSLMGGGGVDGAIHSAAGPQLKRECSQLNGCTVGNAKITKGYNLPSRHVIHTVGPRVGRTSDLAGRCRDDLENCYINSLKLAAANNLRSVAFPCISTGIYGYPNEPAAIVALSTVRSWLEHTPLEKVDRVIFCVFLKEDVNIYQNLIHFYFPINETQLPSPSS